MMKKPYPDNKRRILAQDHYVCDDAKVSKLNLSDICIAGSGTGKTGSYVIPNMLLSSGHSSLVIVDTKSQLYRNYSGYLHDRGMTVRYIDFQNPSLATDSFNPLDYVRDDYLEHDIHTMVHALLTDQSVHEDPFWVMSARSVLSCLIAYVMTKFKPEDRHMGAVAEVFRAFNRDIDKVQKKSSDIGFFQDLASEATDTPYCLKAYYEIRPLLLADKTYGAISQILCNLLSQFDIKQNARMLCSKSSFSFKDLGNERTALFVNVSDTDRSADALATLFYSVLFRELCREADSSPQGRLRIPVRVMLDDFATNVKIPDFDKIISTVRSRNISVSIMLQSITQLEALYGSAQVASTIIGNCDHIILMSTHDLRTAEWAANYAGVLPETILHMDLDHVWLFEKGSKPLYLEKLPPYSFRPGTDTKKHLSINDNQPVSEEEMIYE